MINKMKDQEINEITHKIIGCAMQGHEAAIKNNAWTNTWTKCPCPKY